MTKTQVLVIVGAIVLFVLLLFAKKLPSVKDAALDASAVPAAVSDEDFEKALQQIEPVVKDSITSLVKQKKWAAISSYWLQANHPELAGYAAEKNATATKTAIAWIEAGENYGRALASTPPIKRSAVAAAAIRCFQKSLEIQPTNLDAKAGLGAAYVEGTADPMKGIGLLREVVQQDSTNMKAQLNLAFFSMKSGQFNKAVDRFKKLILLQPDNYELLLYLADGYEKAGDKDNAILTLEQFCKSSPDENLKNEVKNYINKLKINDYAKR